MIWGFMCLLTHLVCTVSGLNLFCVSHVTLVIPHYYSALLMVKKILINVEKAKLSATAILPIK